MNDYEQKSFSVQRMFGPITNSVIDGVISEIKKKKTKEKIMKNIVDPLLCDLTTRYYPYLITITIILVLIRSEEHTSELQSQR